jgi:hypothetical protein
MVRVIQPAGFTRLNLLHIALNDDFDEVVFLCSPESMNELEYERIVLMAKELGSKAVFSRHELPVIGEDATVSDIIENLKSLKDGLSEAETLISTTGGTLKLGACLNYIFSECETISMHEQMYIYSNGNTKAMKKLPEDIAWKLLGLRHEIENQGHKLYHMDELIAKPSNVELKKGKLHLKWENNASRVKKKSKKGKHVPASERAKDISREMGQLTRINSEHRYEFTVPFAKFIDYDRYPINTNRTVQPTKFFKQISNEFFSMIPMPAFPLGEASEDKLCLHIIFNTSDITPTVEAILSHQPDHVVLWYLEDTQDEAKIQEYGGKMAFLTSFIHGELVENLNHFKRLRQSSLLNKNPLQKMRVKFDLAKLSNLEDVSSVSDFPKVQRTIFETNSGFIGFQDKIVRHLQQNHIQFERWHTDLISCNTSIISIHSHESRKIDRDVARSLLLRKRIPTTGYEINTKPEYTNQLSIVLKALLSSKKLDSDGIWRLSKGEYDVNGNKVRIETPKFDRARRTIYPYEFEIYLNGNHFLKLGEAKTGKPLADTNTLGLWLEELVAHMIHIFWKSNYTIIGLNSLPFTGDPTEEGTNDDIDVYALTNHGEVVSEVKAIRGTEPEELIPHIGQLYGELSVVGSRRGQVPILTLGADTEHLDAFAKSMNIVITNWWELEYPDHILHRLRTGERSDGELKLAEKVKLADNLRIAKEVAAAAAKRKAEEEAEAKKQSNDNVVDLEAEDVLFAGEISPEQIHAYPGSEFACTISGVAELEGEVISISRTRFKKFFYPNFINPNTVGYQITVSRKKPKSLSKSKKLVNESKAYMDEVKDIPRIGRE